MVQKYLLDELVVRLQGCINEHEGGVAGAHLGCTVLVGTVDEHDGGVAGAHLTHGGGGLKEGEA